MDESIVTEVEEQNLDEAVLENGEQQEQLGLHLAKGNQLYYQEKFAEALQEYDLALAELKKFQDVGALSKTLYWKAETLVKLQKREEAIQVFKQLLEKCEKHNYAFSAQNRIGHLEELIAMVKGEKM